jgi:NTE family protein
MEYTPILRGRWDSREEFLRRALVLSGGGMFGAWQAGAWAALAGRVPFDLVVGASVGALNGYAIACGVSPAELRRMWLDPNFTRLHGLPETVPALIQRARPVTEFALTVTDLLRLKPRVFRDGQIRAEHLIASCAIPLILPQVRIEGRLYSDGGLLNPLPVWAAVELGATHILALNALPRIPSPWLRPLVSVFRAVAGYHPTVPPAVTVQVIRPPRDLGTMREALSWDSQRIERWLDQGEADVGRAILPAAGF